MHIGESAIESDRELVTEPQGGHDPAEVRKLAIDDHVMSCTPCCQIRDTIAQAGLPGFPGSWISPSSRLYAALESRADTC